MQLNLKKKNYKFKQTEVIDQHPVFFTTRWNYTVNPRSVRRGQDHELRLWKALCHPDAMLTVVNQMWFKITTIRF